MSYLSLFSGIGGFELGISQVFPWMRCMGFSEIDPACLAIYQQHFPCHPPLGDIREVDFRPLRGQVNLVVGGPPCKDLSGMRRGREGLSGRHSRLFWQFVRCLQECKPQYWLMENVHSIKLTDRDIITQALTPFGGRTPVVLDSAHLSPQSRLRLYWSNFPIPPLGQQRVGRTLPEMQRGLRFEDVLEEPESVLPWAHSPRMIESVFNKPQVLRGNVTNKSRFQTFGHFQDTRFVKSKCVGSFLHTPFNNIVMDYRFEPVLIRKLTPVEAERLQGFPDDFTATIPKTSRYRVIGNAVCIPVIVYILECLHHHLEAV